MQNSYWEELDMEQSISEYHEQELQKMNIPNWIQAIHCPFCDVEVPLRAIRKISLCLNTRNYGEISVEVACCSCAKMDTLYFKENINDIYDFINLLSNGQPKSGPMVEESMYKARYNNLIEKMITSDFQV